MLCWVAILGGAVIGSFSGYVITFLKVPAFIATLGMMYVLDGFTLLMTRGTPITNLPSDYKFIGRGYLGPIPFIVVILLVLVAVFAFIFKYTQFGRNIVTVGENARPHVFPVQRGWHQNFGHTHAQAR